MEIQGDNLNGNDDGDEYIEATVDSGAAESVMHRRQGKRCRLRPSTGSKNGFEYVSAAGKVIADEGEKLVRVETENGQECCLTMQLTAVNKALLSVSKICDAGHTVYFNKAEGTITHAETGQNIHFRRIDGVYRIRFKVLGDGSLDFQRRGK